MTAIGFHPWTSALIKGTYRADTPLITHATILDDQSPAPAPPLYRIQNPLSLSSQDNHYCIFALHVFYYYICHDIVTSLPVS